MIVDLSARRLGTLGAPALNTILPPQWPTSGDAGANITYINNWYQQAIPHLNAWAADFFQALRNMGFTVSMITTPETWYACSTCWAYEFNVTKDGFTYRAALQPVNAMQYSSDAFAANVARSWEQERSMAQQPAPAYSYTPPPSTATSSPTSAPTQTTTTTQSVPISAPASSPATGSVKSASLIAPQGTQVGSPWTIVVMGPPGSPVSVAAWQDGQSLGETTYGRTDAQGKFTLSGTFTPETVGTWTEIWKVAGQAVGTITFTVMPAQVNSSPTTSTAQPSAASTSPPTPAPARTVSVGVPSVASPRPATAAPAPAEPATISTWYKSVPTWAWVAAGAGLLFLMKERR